MLDDGEKAGERSFQLIGTVGDMPMATTALDSMMYPVHGIAVLTRPGNLFPPGPCKTEPFLLLDGSFAQPGAMMQTSYTLGCPGMDSVLIALLSLPRVMP